MEWKISTTITIAGLAAGLLLNLTIGVWYTSMLFYRVGLIETRLSQSDVRESDTQKIVSAAIVTETKLSVQLDNLKELLDRLLARQEDAEYKKRDGGK